MPSIFTALTRDEGDYCRFILQEMQGVPWAQPLLSAIERGGGVCNDTMPLLFELRVAYELHKCGAKPITYEHSAGVGESSIDFRVGENPSWLVELVSLQESLSVRKSTRTSTTGFTETSMFSGAEEEHNRPEAELINLENRIGTKVLGEDGQPTKFPLPAENQVHVVLVDTRAYGATGGDFDDWRQATYGAQAVRHPANVLDWRGKPIKGLFETDNTSQRAAPLVQERIHFIGFVGSAEYTFGGIRRNTFWTRNPSLLPDYYEASRLIEASPLLMCQ